MKQEGSFFESTPSFHNENTMRMMLDSESLLREVEIFLKGYYTQNYYNEELKSTQQVKIEVGEAKANDKGVQSIMFWLRTKINPLISLSNMKEDQYYNFLFRSRKSLASNLMVQRVNYGINLANYTEIIDVIIESFEAFFTSAISGGHRKAFTTNTETKVSETIEKDKKLFGVI